MTRSAAASKSQRSNPKSQKSKTDPSDSGGGIIPQPSREPVPMKPRRGLFMALMGLFVAWVAVMLGMYFTMVRPREHSAPQPSPSQEQQPAPTTRAVALMPSAD